MTRALVRRRARRPGRAGTAHGGGDAAAAVHRAVVSDRGGARAARVGLAGQARAAAHAASDSPCCPNWTMPIDWLAARAADAPVNFLHLLRLVEAERAWATGRLPGRGGRLRRGAARRRRTTTPLAPGPDPRTRGPVLSRPRHRHASATQLLAQARQEYLTWGATAKVDQLDWAYPTILPTAPTPARTGRAHTRRRRTAPVEHHDRHDRPARHPRRLASPQLRDQHRRPAHPGGEVLCAMTGATGVHLLLWNDDEHGWLLPTPGGPTAPAGRRRRAASRRLVPLSVVRYVERTREPLVVSDATHDDRFARDPYFDRRRPLLAAGRADPQPRHAFAHCCCWRTGSSAARSPPTASTASCSSPDSSPSSSTTRSSTPRWSARSPNAPSSSTIANQRLEQLLQHHRPAHRPGQPAPVGGRARRRMAPRQALGPAPRHSHDRH